MSESLTARPKSVQTAECGFHDIENFYLYNHFQSTEDLSDYSTNTEKCSGILDSKKNPCYSSNDEQSEDSSLNPDVIDLDKSKFEAFGIDLIEEYSLTPSPTVSCITPFTEDCVHNQPPPLQLPISMHQYNALYACPQNVTFGEEYFATQFPPKFTVLPSFEGAQFNQMDIGSILELKFGIKELVRCNLIYRLMKDQCGSRYLQDLLKSYISISDSRECENIITSLVNHLISTNIDLTAMSEHVYGNHLISLLFVHGSDLHHEILLNYFVYPSTLRLCQAKHGCRVIGKILSSVQNLNRLLQLVECFRKQANIRSNCNSIHEYLLCCNTSHIIRTMIELKLPYEAVQFIGNALENNLICYSENVYACRAVQAFVRCYADKLDVNKLFLNAGHIYLSQVKFGNYVIQCIIKKDEWYSNLSEIRKFRNQLIDHVFKNGNILYLSKDKHGSNVIETCIKVANEKQIETLTNIICAKQGFLLKEMLADKFGNYIPKTLLEHCQTRQRIILVNTLHSHITDLYQNYHIFRYCAYFIKQCQRIKYSMDTKTNNRHNTHSNVATHNKQTDNYNKRNMYTRNR